VKRQPLILAGLALFCFGVMGLKDILTSTSAQSPSSELLVGQFPLPNNPAGSRVRSVSRDGKRMVFESSNNFVGENGEQNLEIYLYDRDLQRLIQITNTQHGANPFVSVANIAPSINADGTQIVFYSNAAGLGDMPNTNYNYEIYLATLPPGATAPTMVTRLTNTGLNSNVPGEDIRGKVTNYDPAISDNGNVIAFVSNRQVFNPTNVAGGFNANNADGNGEIMVLRRDSAGTPYQYIQVTASQNQVIFGPANFNSRPMISGNGLVLAFLSDFNYEGRNVDAGGDFVNEEIFLSRYDSVNNRFTTIQVTDTLVTGGLGALVPVLDLNTGLQIPMPSAPANLLPQFTNPLSNDGRWLVLESAGNYDGINSSKTRNLWLYDTVNRSFRRLTNQTVGQVPTQGDLARLDYNFQPSINSAGTLITFNTTQNLVPTSPSDPNTDNGDGSKEFFLFDTTSGSFRQLTFMQPSLAFLEQRLNTTQTYISDPSTMGDTRISFSYNAQSFLPNATNTIDLFQIMMRPINSPNNGGAAIGNAASFDTNQIGRGSRAVSLGPQINRTFSPMDPYIVNGVSVRVGRVAARISSIMDGRVTFVLPNGLANGVVDFSINDNGVQYTGNVVIADASPGISTLSGDPTGPANVGCLSNGVWIPRPCTVGSIMVIIGTGWRNAASGTQVKINDTTLTPIYSGLQDPNNGMDQINVTIPAELSGVTGATLSVITVNTNIESNRTTVDIAGPSASLTVLTDGAGRADVDCISNIGRYYDPPCVPGNVMSIYGTGWRSSPSTQVRIGTTIVTPTYSGIQGPTLDQINIIVPPELAGATDLPLTVITTSNNVESNTAPVSFLGPPTSLTIDTDGTGRAAVDCVSSAGVYHEQPCAPGETLVIYGTGWRAAPSMQVRIAGMLFTPFFSGPQGGTVDQINVAVSPSLAGLTDVPISVLVTGTTIESNTATISFLPSP
jgi:uncharacterized protein (TIGR03437 family)